MKKILSALFLMSLLASCGGGSDSGSGSIFQEEDNYKSGNCGSQVVSDHNTVILDCQFMYTRSDIEQCISGLQEFKSKYPGINCNAERQVGLEREIFTINESYINGLIESAQNL